ncbi:MAG: hypothetical protein CL840_06990 [Crocinitomicaceae bacterium]|nr:hypothetical protein [Crocinitomicaceae bacterium]|tara:strand:+ start:15271 stop:15567 length:297 start_codon:yes stop_codon:yes gene_type:complete
MKRLIFILTLSFFTLATFAQENYKYANLMAIMATKSITFHTAQESKILQPKESRVQTSDILQAINDLTNNHGWVVVDMEAVPAGINTRLIYLLRREKE